MNKKGGEATKLNENVSWHICGRFTSQLVLLASINLLSLLSVWSSNLQRSKSNVDCVKLYWPVCSIILTISCSLCGSCKELRCLCNRLSELVSQLFGEVFFELDLGVLVAVDGGWSSLSLSLLESEPLDSPLFFGFFFGCFIFACWRSPSSADRFAFDGGMALALPPVITPPALSNLVLNSSLGFWKVRHSLLIWLMGGSFRLGRRRSYSKRTFLGSSLFLK